MGALGYIRDSERAMRLFFDGLAVCDFIHYPSYLDYRDDTGKIVISKKENQRIMRQITKSLDLMFSRATLAGAILQVAFMGVKSFSTNISFPPGSKNFDFDFNNPKEYRQKFFIGRKVHDIPIGLLIYAGRIQYNHWTDGADFNDLTKSVFLRLNWAYIDDPMKDLTYNLGYPAPSPVSHYIVRKELKWMEYDDYLKDMKSMLVKRRRKADV